LDHEEDGAVKVALENRLDLMNERAQVVDAWRKIKVAANDLEGGLDVILSADIPTKPGSDNPVNFSATAGRYRAGLLIEGPLDRKAERNTYRSELIEYQKARRSYMALEDEITREVRRDTRQLGADRLNFEIARQSLIAAARQVEQSRDQLTAPGPAGDSSSTQDVLDALSSLLSAKNALIGTWVAYETNRMRLLLDIETVGLEEEAFLKK
jgi:outer membrane protein TolC